MATDRWQLSKSVVVQNRFDFREGVTKRVAKPDNRRVGAAEVAADAQDSAAAALALLRHNQARLKEEQQRTIPRNSCAAY